VSACRELGKLFFFSGPDDDYRRRGAALLHNACSRHDGIACLFIGFATGKGTVAEAAPWYARSCALGIGDGCTVLSNMTLPNSRAREAQRIWAQKRACSFGDGDACMEMAIDAHDRKDDKSAMSLLEQACSNGLDYACRILRRNLYVAGPA